MELRDYQQRAVASVLAEFKTHRSIVAVGPTGSGKTVIGAAVTKGGKRILWLAHRVELLRQARDGLVAAGVPKADIGLLSGVEKTNPNARVTVASIDMFRARPAGPFNPDLIVVDEAHRSAAQTYQDVIDVFPRAKVLGLTATPWRLDGKPLGDTFDAMVSIAGINELIAEGYLARPATYGIPKEKAKALTKGLRRSGGDFSSKLLGERMMRGTLMGDVVAECAKRAEGLPTIVYAASIEHGENLAKRFRKAGFGTAFLSGETPAGARAMWLDALKRGEIQVIVNVDVLSEGFDCPPVKCIALCRPTESLTRFLQQAGRASRPFELTKPIILDHAGNCWRFGLPDAEREWSLDEDAVGAGGAAPVKRCVLESCGFMIPAGFRLCPECGTEQPLEEQERIEINTELELLRATEAERNRMRSVLEKLAGPRGLGRDWVDRVCQEHSI